MYCWQQQRRRQPQHHRVVRGAHQQQQRRQRPLRRCWLLRLLRMRPRHLLLQRRQRQQQCRWLQRLPRQRPDLLLSHVVIIHQHVSIVLQLEPHECQSGITQMQRDGPVHTQSSAVVSRQRIALPAAEEAAAFWSCRRRRGHCASAVGACVPAVLSHDCRDALSRAERKRDDFRMQPLRRRSGVQRHLVQLLVGDSRRC